MHFQVFSKERRKSFFFYIYSCHSSNHRLMHLNIIAYICVMRGRGEMIRKRLTCELEEMNLRNSPSVNHSMSNKKKKKEE